MHPCSSELPLQVSGVSRGSRERLNLGKRGFLRLGSRCAVVLLLLLFTPVACQRGNLPTCPEEFRDGAFWPATVAGDVTAGRVSSRPLCLAEDRSLVTRRCVAEGDHGIWIPSEAPSCAHVHPTYEGSDKCPPPFRNLTSGPVCAYLGKPGPWDRAISQCFLSGTSKSLLDLEGDKLEAVLSYLQSELWSLNGEDLHLVSRWDTRTVWLDGRRNKALTPIVRKLPGDFERMGVRWKELVNATVPWAQGEPSFSPEKQCLAMDVPLVGPPSIRMESCLVRRRAICVFVPPSDVQFPLLTRLACPDGYVTSLYQGEQHRCFQIRKDADDQPKHSASPADRCATTGDSLARLSSAHVNALFVEMAKAKGLTATEKCLMGLSKKGDSYIWQGDDDEKLKFVSWDADTNFDTGEVGVVRGDGRWELIPCRQSLLVGCVVCERPALVPPRARMTLRLHPPSGRLLLSVYSGEGLWRYGGAEPVACFSDGYFGEARRLKLQPPVRDGRWSLYNLRGLQPDRHPKLSFTELHKTVFVLPMAGDVGRYWCEARRVVGLRPLVTERVWNSNVKRGRFIFSLALEANGVCSGKHGIRDCEPTFGSRHYEVAVELRRKLKLTPGSIRPIRILSVVNGNLCLLLHVAVTMKPEEGMSESVMEHGVYLRLMVKVLDIIRGSEGKYELLWLRSTRGCIQSYSRMEGISAVIELHWDACPLGYSAVSREICLQAPKGDVPVIRTCRGDYMFGGIWDSPSGVCSDLAPPQLTSDLHTLMLEARSGVNASAIVRKAAELSSRPADLNSADIHFLAMTMRAVAASASTLRADVDLGHVTSVADHVMRGKRANVALSQRILNSTNVLLDALDDIFAEIVLERDEENLEGLENSTGQITRIGGVYAAVASQIAVQISDVSTSNNVMGVALARKPLTSAYTLGHRSESENTEGNLTGFIQYSLLPLTSEQTLESLADLQPEVAVLLPMEMLPDGQLYIGDDSNSSASNTSKPTRVVTTLFFSDLPFKPAEGVSVLSFDSDEDDDDMDEDKYGEESDEDDDIIDEQVNSHVISVWTSGLGPDLPAPVPILFRPLRPVGKDHSRHCAHWDFSASAWGGGWASDGCFFVGTMSDGMDVCICTHLTHFAELLFSRQRTMLEGHDEASLLALDIISVVGCALSLVGVAGIVVTALVFRRWRHRLGSKILLHLTAAIGLEMTMFLVFAAVEFSPDSTEAVWCLILGCSLHYSIIATFCWMLVASALQYIRFVRILGDYRPPRFLLKAAGFAWGFPMIPVALILSLDQHPYGVDLRDGVSFNTSFPVSEDDSSFCYPSGISLILGVVLPVTFVVLANLVVYLLILRSILTSVVTRSPSSPQFSASPTPYGTANVANGVSHKSNVEQQEKVFAVRHFRLAVLLFFLLGLSWMFGIFSKIFRLSVFSYLFCTTATIQGFVLFVFYVVGDPNTRQLWSRKLRGMAKHLSKTICCSKIISSSWCKRSSSNSEDGENATGMSSGGEMSRYHSSSKSSSLSE